MFGNKGPCPQAADLSSIVVMMMMMMMIFNPLNLLLREIPPSAFHLHPRVITTSVNEPCVVTGCHQINALTFSLLSVLNDLKYMLIGCSVKTSQHNASKPDTCPLSDLLYACRIVFKVF